MRSTVTRLLTVNDASRSLPKKSLFEPLSLLMLGAVVIAWFFPAAAPATSALEWLAKGLVFSLFFFQGVRLAPEELRSATRNLPVHAVILGITFGFFPLLCLALTRSPSSAGLAEFSLGLSFLGAAPSTIQSSVIFTSIARGNVALAVCAASLSSTIGILLTPLLFSLSLGTSVALDGVGQAIARLSLELFVPLVLGQLLRAKLLEFSTKKRSLLKNLDQGAIVLIVYLAFSDAFEKGVFARLPLTKVLLLGGVLGTLFTAVFGAARLVASLLRLPEKDRIAVYFCASKKSLASGAPMAKVLLPGVELGTLLLPLMIYHQLQLLLCSFIAARFGARASDAEFD